ncbi:N-acetylmuramoyl-L-alanine amidase [[Pseudomonas] boreopolis]|uniref:N-acetylmuramoyl-L-alanine amidase n=1 Tax=Xanthomonas boreopolis TaxID=86183 RepID=UPI003DA0BA50
MSLGNRQFIVLALAASLGAAGFGVDAGEIRGVSLSSGSTGTRAEIQLAGSGGYKTISLAGPNRLVVDFPDSAAARGLKMPAPGGVVTAVRTGQPVPGTFRVVFDLAGAVVAFKPQMLRNGSGSTLVIEWPGEGSPDPAAAPKLAQGEPQPAAAVTVAPDARAEAARATSALTASVVRAATAAPATPPPAAPEPRPATPATTPGAPPAIASASASASASATGASPAAILNGAAVAANAPAAKPPADPPGGDALDPEIAPRPVMPSAASRVKMAAGMRPLVVAIDPGHGGQDPGAIGPTGKREKDVTLAVARELARQVNATPGLKAYLTRDSDVFIPLPMRAKKARAAGADIFISIHADAAENRSASGSSVYVLSTKGASSQRARWLADKENAADLVGGVRLQQTEDTLANVLIDLAQSGHMKASEDAAGHVLGGLKRIGNNHKPHLERANFAVLRTSDMPAMLVETAFISNPEEERRLTDPAYQRRLASAVLDGVNTFFTRQPPPGTLYAARAQAEAEAAAGTVAGGSR